MRKNMKTKPTDAELEILKVLWEHGPSTVKFINDIQNRERKVGYTTTLKIMQIMTEKKSLKRDESSRSHIYKPMIAEDETKTILVDKLLDSAFGGSAAKLVTQALGNYKASKEEIDEIRQLLDKMEDE